MHAAAVPLLNASQRTETLLVTTLLQLIVMVGAARLFNRVFQALGQPGVVGEIIAGLLLGPSLFGHFFPHAAASLFGTGPSPVIAVLSQLGLILLMFQIGMGFEFGQLRQARARRAVFIVAAVSVLVPFACGVGVGYASHAAFAGGVAVPVYALFCGVAMAITAVPILGRILVFYGLAQHELGVLAISAAALNDIAGWIMLGVVSALATASFAPGAVALQLSGLAVFALVCWFGLRPAVAWGLRAVPVGPTGISPSLMALTLMLVFGLGICTFRLGIFGIFGGFVAGLLVHHDQAFADAWRRQVGGFVTVLFLPIFFTSTGLHTDVLGLTGGQDWAWALGISLVAIAAKILPVGLAARACRYAGWEAFLLGTLMNTRALMELIVLNIGLETGFLPPKIFTMLVLMAVVTTMMTGPLLNVALARLGLRAPRQLDA